MKLLEKTMRMNYLFDFYQALLTPKQRKYMHLYYLEDYSLVEIAKLANVSRQAVYDNIKRTESILESYENQLFLYQKFQQREKLLTKLQELTPNITDHHEIETIINQLKELG